MIGVLNQHVVNYFMQEANWLDVLQSFFMIFVTNENELTLSS